MLNAKLTLQSKTIKEIEELNITARKIGDHRTIERIRVAYAYAGGYSLSEIAGIFKRSYETIRSWVNNLILKGAASLKSNKSPGRPPKLTKSQRDDLDKAISAGPSAAGFPGACWRTPMIQELVKERYGVFYSVNYLSQLLKNMGFSYQKAKFDAAHKDAIKRKEWLEVTWPQIIEMAKTKESMILFGDEASFPQWGSLTYTWAKKGEQPVVKTSGIRKAYRTFGLIDYYSGRFYYKTHEEKLNSDSYTAFLKEVLAKSNKHIILIQDGAPYHTSKAMKEFFAANGERLSVFRLPSYSPDYNPIEKLWKKIKEDEIHLHYFPTFDSLKNKVEEALVHFDNLQEEVLSLFGFYRELNEMS